MATTKRCTTCTRILPLAAFCKRGDRWQSWCRQCNAAKCADYRRQVVAKPAYVSDPLNLALRDMPGNRGQLIGAREFVQFAEAA